MREIIDARQTIGSAYDQAKQLKDPDDKLIILKMGYYYATQEVPDPTKRTEYWHLLDIDKYLRAVIFKHAVDIRHARDRKQIKHKYGDFKHAFNQRQNCGGRGGQGAGIFDDRGWQEHKQAHGNQYGKDGDKDIKNPYGAFAQMRVHPFVKFGRFLILGEAGQLR